MKQNRWGGRVREKGALKCSFCAIEWPVGDQQTVSPSALTISGPLEHTDAVGKFASASTAADHARSYDSNQIYTISQYGAR